jgi:ABC-type multidrug transport system permease subunit
MQFSGMLIPVSSMTGLNYFLAQGMPPRYFNDAVMYTFLKNGGLFSSWRELLALLFAMCIFLALGYAVFHKRSKV